MPKKQNKKTNKNQEMIFDASFATMVEEFPALLIPIINEVFGTSYSEDAATILHRDRHHRNKGFIVTDVLVEICGVRYHIECQCKEDGTMQIRMLEYDFNIALEHAKHNKDYMEVNFPKSCILQLRSRESTPERLRVKLNFQDGSGATYSVPVVKVGGYSYNEMFEKGLLMLIPFYGMRYERAVKLNDEEELSKLYSDMTEIIKRLQSKDDEMPMSNWKKVIVELFVKICYYIGNDNKSCVERMDDIMSDNPLNLETIRFLHQGRVEGRVEGKAEGTQEAILELLEDYGEIGDELKAVIYNQKDIKTLKSWHKAASKANSIGEFENEIGLVK